MQFPDAWHAITAIDGNLWQSTRAVSSLKEDAIHIWQFTHDQPKSVVDSLYPTLSNAEKQRVERYYTPELRARSIVRRGILRYLLGMYLNQTPHALSFSYSNYNKPYLATEDIFFNVSHSKERVLIAICKETEIGVDIEAVEPLPDLTTVAKHHFSSQEQNMLFSLDTAEQIPSFYRCWTRKEAFIKADGRGLSIALDAFDVTLKPNQAARITRLDEHLQAIYACEWQLHHLQINEDFMAALAYNGERRPINFFLLA